MTTTKRLIIALAIALLACALVSSNARAGGAAVPPPHPAGWALIEPDDGDTLVMSYGAEDLARLHWGIQTWSPCDGCTPTRGRAYVTFRRLGSTRDICVHRLAAGWTNGPTITENTEVHCTGTVACCYSHAGAEFAIDLAVPPENTIRASVELHIDAPRYNQVFIATNLSDPSRWHRT